jgi:hypothetical protein
MKLRFKKAGILFNGEAEIGLTKDLKYKVTLKASSKTYYIILYFKELPESLMLYYTIDSKNWDKHEEKYNSTHIPDDSIGVYSKVEMIEQLLSSDQFRKELTELNKKYGIEENTVSLT